MTPKIVDKSRRRKEIAFAALDLLAEQDFHSTTISQIAQAAGVGKGTIYEYFESKEDLIRFAIVSWVEEIEEKAGKILDATTPSEQRLRKFVHAMMEGFLSDERVVRISIGIFQAVFANENYYAHLNLARDIFQGTRKRITDLLLEGISGGTFRSEVAMDAEAVAINLIAYLDGIGLHYLLSRGYFDLERQIDHYLDTMFEALKPADSTGRWTEDA